MLFACHLAQDRIINLEIEDQNPRLSGFKTHTMKLSLLICKTGIELDVLLRLTQLKYSECF